RQHEAVGGAQGRAEHGRQRRAAGPLRQRQGERRDQGGGGGVAGRLRQEDGARGAEGGQRPGALGAGGGQERRAPAVGQAGVARQIADQQAAGEQEDDAPVDAGRLAPGEGGAPGAGGPVARRQHEQEAPGRQRDHLLGQVIVQPGGGAASR